MLVVLICDGDKSSQQNDIARAKDMASTPGLEWAMKKTQTRPWDSAFHLRTEEEIAAYLDAALEGGGDDPKFIAHALGVIARAHDISQLAKETQVKRESLYRALSG